MRAIGRARETRPRRAPRLVFAGVAMLIAVNAVAAAAADAAVPGDVLYPLDRGYERVADLVALGGDRTGERVTEAEVLVSRGEHMTAVDLIAESVETDAVQGAVAALRAVDPSDSELPAHVEALVEGVHEFVEARREGEGQRAEEATAAVRFLALRVGELARQSQPDQSGRPDQTPGEGPPDQVPGDTGRSRGEGTGPDGETGPPDRAVPGDTAPGPPSSNPGGGGEGRPDHSQGNDDPRAGTQPQEPPGGDTPGATRPERGGGR